MKINWKSAIIKGIGVAAVIVGYVVDQYSEGERIDEAVNEKFQELGLVKIEDDDFDDE